MMIAHVDMDAFFAACEEKKNPALKDKSVIIGADPKSKRGIVSTCNYNARKFGIHSAMPISEAVRRCPDGVYIRGDFEYYREVSRVIMVELEEFGPIEQMSIDEAYIDITDLQDQYSLAEIAKMIKSAVLGATQLSCSVGVAQSRYVAKIASDFKKPGGIIVVNDVRRFLAPLPIRKIPGIGKKSAPRIMAAGVKTIGDIASLDAFVAKDLFGKWYVHLLRLARGEDRTGIKQHGKRKSQSVERTYEEDKLKGDCVEDIKRISKVLHERLKGKVFRTVSLKVRFEGFETITRDHSIKVPTDSLDVMLSSVLYLFDEVDTSKKIRLVGVKVGNFLYSADHQLTLDEFFKREPL